MNFITSISIHILRHKLCKYLSGVISERWFIGRPVKRQWAPWYPCNSCIILSQRLEWETQRILNFSYKTARITFRRWLIWCVFLPWAFWIGLMGITLLRLYYHNPALDTVDLCSCHNYIKPLYFFRITRVYVRIVFLQHWSRQSSVKDEYTASNAINRLVLDSIYSIESNSSADEETHIYYRHNTQIFSKYYGVLQ